MWRRTLSRLSLNVQACPVNYIRSAASALLNSDDVVMIPPKDPGVHWSCNEVSGCTANGDKGINGAGY